jgi:elongation factor P hydroxylase
MVHQYQDLIEIFHQTFYHQYQTRLVKGEREPIYSPADECDPDHRIIFAHGFYASGLHEISHWLVAGSARRAIEDFGYWYQPDGRTTEQQLAFESAEVKPQAIEWALCVCAGFAFNVSCDNLDGEQPDHVTFQHRVYDQIGLFLKNGFPKRVGQLMQALSDFYQTELPTTLTAFSFEGLVKETQCEE